MLKQKDLQKENQKKNQNETLRYEMEKDVRMQNKTRNYCSRRKLMNMDRI